MTKRICSDLTARALTLTPGTINEAERSIEAVLATEGHVQVFDMRSWKPIQEILRMDGAKLPEQAILLDTHARWSIEDVRGSVKEIRQEGSTVVGRLYFAEDEASERAWQKVKGGHIRSVSAGYQVDIRKAVMIEPGKTRVVNGKRHTAGDLPLRIATDWELREVSLVPIGADPSATTRSLDMENEPMDKDAQNTEPQAAATPPAAPPADVVRTTVVPEPPKEPAVDLDAVRAEAAQAERKRVADLHARAGDDVPEDVLKRAIDEGMTVEQASGMFLDAVRTKRAPAVGTGVEMGEHRPDEMYRAITAAIGMRFGADVEDAKLREAADEFRGITLCQVAQEVLRSEGVRNVPYNRQELFTRAVSSGSFATLLGNSATKSLMKAYRETPQTASAWCGRRTTDDFKTYSDIKLSEFNRLTKVGKGGEIDHGTIKESSEEYSVDTYGKRFVLTRQDMINDDLNGFMTIPQKLGRAAARNVDEIVYALLVSGTSNLGPTMNEDSEQLFSASHAQSNYNAGAAYVLASAGLKQARLLMRKMKGLSDEEGVAGPTLNLKVDTLLLPAALEDTGLELTTSRGRITGASSTLMEKNIYAGSARLIVEGRLDDTSTTGWYAIANRNEQDNIVIVDLNGHKDPVVERNDPPAEILGIGWQVYHDIGAAAVDWRGIVYNDGTD